MLVDRKSLGIVEAKPETLMEWASQADTLRARLARMPVDHPLVKTGMRDCQAECITQLEQSFVAARPHAIIQMATGAGKTYTACAFTYRLIKHAGAKRVLFLVNRANLGRQTMAAFQQYVTPDTGRKFVAELERQLSVVEEQEAVVSVNLQRATRLRQAVLHRAFSQ